MARPREFDEATVLRRARAAFRDKGYNGTSMQDLVEATGLGKGSLYAAFGDKRGLYQRVLDDYSAGSIEGIRDALEGPEPARQALRAYLLGVARASATGPSCLLASSTAEMANVDAAVGAAVKQTFGTLQERMVA